MQFHRILGRRKPLGRESGCQELKRVNRNRLGAWGPWKRTHGNQSVLRQARKCLACPLSRLVSHQAPYILPTRYCGNLTAALSPHYHDSTQMVSPLLAHWLPNQLNTAVKCAKHSEHWKIFQEYLEYRILYTLKCIQPSADLAQLQFPSLGTCSSLNTVFPRLEFSPLSLPTWQTPTHHLHLAPK